MSISVYEIKKSPLKASASNDSYVGGLSKKHFLPKLSTVIPAKAGIQSFEPFLDSRLLGSDVPVLSMFPTISCPAGSKSMGILCQMLQIGGENP